MNPLTFDINFFDKDIIIKYCQKYKVIMFSLKYCWLNNN